MKMLLNGKWGCCRLWYHGPPGARSLYFYRNLYHPPFRPMFGRHHQGTWLIGTRRHHFAFSPRYPS